MRKNIQDNNAMQNNNMNVSTYSNNFRQNSSKYNKGLIIFLILLVLGLGVYIVYDKVLGGNINLSIGSSKEPSSEPLNETFETSEKCAEESDDSFMKYGMNFKPAKELSVNRANLIKSSYPLYQAYYCYDMGCQEKEMTAKELEEYKNETDGYGLILKVTVSNGVATIYDYGETGKLQTTKKLDLQGVKGVSATFTCGGDEGPYGIMALDKNNDLYLIKYDNSDEKPKITSQKLFYKNVKDFALNILLESDVFGSYDGCRWDPMAIHTLDGKSIVIDDFNLDNIVDLNNVNELTAYWETGVGINNNIFVSTSKYYTYQKYNDKEIKVKGLFVKNATESKDEEEVNYDAVIHLVTENDEHLYYRFDDCEHKYRLYTNGKVKSLTYDTNRKKAIITYTDGNKVEFDYNSKIEF